MFIGMFPFNLPSLFVFVAAAWRIKDGTLTRQLPTSPVNLNSSLCSTRAFARRKHCQTLCWRDLSPYQWYLALNTYQCLVHACSSFVALVSSQPPGIPNFFSVFQNVNDDLWGGSTQQDLEDSLAEERSESFEIRSTSNPKCRAKKHSPKLAPCPSACCWPRMVCHVGRHLAFDPAVNHSASLLISDAQNQHQNLQKHAAHWGEAVT